MDNSSIGLADSSANHATNNFIASESKRRCRSRRAPARRSSQDQPTTTTNGRLSTNSSGSSRDDQRSPTSSSFTSPTRASSSGTTTSKLDPSLRSLIGNYIKSDQLFNCLELAGFTSSHVLASLSQDDNSDTLHQLEQFVAHACSLMPTEDERLPYLGPLFARHPAQFRLPAGFVIGLRLASRELQRLCSPSQSTTTPWQCTTSLCIDRACQTVELDTSMDDLPPDVNLASAPANSPPTSLPVAETGKAHHNSTLDHPTAASDSMAFSSSVAANSNQQIENDNISSVYLQRLKEQSSASTSRLASRQFDNADLVQGRDFDIGMEISLVNSVKRVTGIFYCHLCRESRERTSAVRFTIGRNRYPVMSNVLAHLKIHFPSRTPWTSVTTSSSSSTQVIDSVALPTSSHLMPSLPPPLSITNCQSIANVKLPPSSNGPIEDGDDDDVVLLSDSLPLGHLSSSAESRNHYTPPSISSLMTMISRGSNSVILPPRVQFSSRSNFPIVDHPQTSMSHTNNVTR